MSAESGATGARPTPDRTAPAAPDAAAPLHPAQVHERNRLLRALPAGAYEQLLPHLEPIDVATGQTLWRADAPIHAVYFPRTCVASLLTPLADEHAVESATVGWEGLVGVPVVLGAPATHTEAIGQIAGAAARVDAGHFRAWLAAADGASALLLRYAQALLEQTAQSVACNRRHAMEERCARWLLATRDRVGASPSCSPTSSWRRCSACAGRASRWPRGSSSRRA